VTITPLGAAVEPEVYWRKAGVSGARASSGPSGPGAVPGSSSAASHCAAASSGTRAPSAAADASRSAVVSTARGRALRAIAASRGLSRRGCGG
jgi:hypothetical protein